MRIVIIILCLVLCGCTSPHRPAAASSRGILDEVLAKPAHASAVQQAERDLPADEWEDTPYRHNVSRFQRESAVALAMLRETAPKLKKMSVTELVRSLKVTSRDDLGGFNGVAGDVFEWGNAMIIAEIQLRPKEELKVLSGLAEENVVVYEGTQGPGDTLAMLIHSRLLTK